MKKALQTKIIILAVIGVVVLLNSLFVVVQTQQAIVLEFGKPVEFKDGDKVVTFISTPGLKMKVPFIQDVVYFDNRVLNFSVNDLSVTDFEKKSLIVNAFAKYKIIEPLKFYEKVTNITGINNKLKRIFEASMGDVIGKVHLRTLLTGERTSIMQSIKNDVSEKASDFGIAIFDVRFVRADLPTENSNAIHKRMFSDRNKEAREYRAKGKEDAKKITSTALKEATILRANAEKQAEITRGEGDGIAAKIYADAFNKDPDFFHFYRTMNSYRKGIDKKDTQVVLSPNSEFLRYFGNINGTN